MAFTLTAIIVSICLIDTYVIGHWVCNTNITPIKDKKTSFAILLTVKLSTKITVGQTNVRTMHSWEQQRSRGAHT